MKYKILALLLGSITTASMAHSPFVAPNSYLVNGGNTGIIAGFAEQPFDSEVAIRGFDFQVIYPDGEIDDLTLLNSKTMSIADVDTAQAGTYQVIGTRSADIKYAKQGRRWLRVLDAKADAVAPLAERQFTIPSEITAKTPQMSVKRHDVIQSYFTKKSVSPVNTVGMNNGLSLYFSEHPNKITLNQPLTLQVKLQNTPAVNYQVELEKQPMQDSEKVEVIKLITNTKGEVVLPIKMTGQYVVTVISPELKEAQQPDSETYRSIVSFYVNP